MIEGSVERAPEEQTQTRTSSRRFSTTASIMASTTSGSTALKPSPRSPLALRPHSSQAYMFTEAGDGACRTQRVCFLTPLTCKASETATHVLGVSRINNAPPQLTHHTTTWEHPQSQRHAHVTCTCTRCGTTYSPQRRHPPCALGPRGKGQGRCLRPGVPSPGPALATLCCLLQLLQQQFVHLGPTYGAVGA